MSKEKKASGKFHKKSIIIAASVIVFVLALVIAVTIPKQIQAQRLAEQLDLGEKYLSELDYEQAIVAYLKAIEIDPKCEDAYLALADIYMATGEFEKAEEILRKAEKELGVAEKIKEKIKGAVKQTAKVTPESTPTDVPKLAPVSTPQANNLTGFTLDELEYVQIKIGDIIRFGKYEQDDVETNGKEEIEWIVLDKYEGKALLCSKYLLEAVVYDDANNNDTSWGGSILRKWLNHEFYLEAFSSEEQESIATEELYNYGEYDWTNPISDSEDTYDKVFILSNGEFEVYFSEGTGSAKATKYAERKSGLATSVYWSRTPEFCIDDEGHRYLYGNTCGTWYVRPCVWIKYDDVEEMADSPVEAFGYVTNEQGGITITALLDDSYKRIVIPQYIDNRLVTCIASWAFEYCDKVKSIDVPDGVRIIENYAFYNCKNLELIKIPASVEEMDCMFYGCERLRKIEIDEDNLYYLSEDGVLYSKDRTILYRVPAGRVKKQFNMLEGVLEIKEGAFEDSRYSEIIVSDGVRTIGRDAFRQGKNLQYVRIPASVEVIEDGVFNYSDYLQEIEVDKQNHWYLSEDGVLYNKEKTILYRMPEGKIVDAFIIPDTVQKIAPSAFSGTGITSVEIPLGVTQIEFGTFSLCENLSNVTIPDSVTVIKSSAFGACTGLTNITIPKSVIVIEEDAFWGCENLTIITPSGSGAEIYAIENNIPVKHP